MPFTESEIAEHTALIEELFWSRRRPPLHLRDKIREGQRLDGFNIELFFVRPSFFSPEQIIEEDISRIQWVSARKIWKLYWKRADLKWHASGQMTSPKITGSQSSPPTTASYLSGVVSLTTIMPLASDLATLARLRARLGRFRSGPCPTHVHDQFPSQRGGHRPRPGALVRLEGRREPLWVN